ncbi:unnamed protein product [Prunus armeniaca]
MPTRNQKRVLMKSVKPRRGRGLLGFLRPNGRKSRVFLYAKSKRPMNLGTVKSKLEKGVYASADGFAADVRLIFSNAFIYSPLGSKNRAAAKHLSRVFETQWKEAEENMSKTACPPPLPKRRPNGKSSSALPSKFDRKQKR